MKYTVKTIRGNHTLGAANALPEAKEIASRHSHGPLRWTSWREETWADGRTTERIYSDDDEMIERNRR